MDFCNRDAPSGCGIGLDCTERWRRHEGSRDTIRNVAIVKPSVFAMSEFNRRDLIRRAAVTVGAFSASSLRGGNPGRGLEILPFGKGGGIKMLYDVRQRPQAVHLRGRVFIGFKGDGTLSQTGKQKTSPMLISYDPRRRRFSEALTLGRKTSDHHHGPIIWADEKEFLHVLFGCHKTPGVHLIAKRPADMGRDLSAWTPGPQIALKLSYPTVFRIHGAKELIYFRTDGHASSWTYRINGDNGKTWAGPETDVVDLDSRGRAEWSSYQTKLPSEDGRFLHVAFTDYDDVKSNDPKRLFNPRYKQPVSNGWKYNLSYLKIDLETHVVRNANGDVLETPVDIDQVREKARVWDTEGRGAGVPPAMALDDAGEPTFLHVLSEDNLRTHSYYFVRRENGQWMQTAICRSNHQWNSGHIARDKNGVLHAYAIVGEGYLDSAGLMDKHGGGRIEEWVSTDRGKSWNKRRDLLPEGKEYVGWRFNNVQPVTRPDGTAVEGMLLFYGWKNENAPEARAFLLHENQL